MKRFFRHHARQLLRVLFNDGTLRSEQEEESSHRFDLSADNVWFQNFRQHLISMRNEYLALSAHCLEGGEPAAMDFIINRHVTTSC